MVITQLSSNMAIRPLGEQMSRVKTRAKKVQEWLSTDRSMCFTHWTHSYVHNVHCNPRTAHTRVHIAHPDRTPLTAHLFDSNVWALCLARIAAKILEIATKTLDFATKTPLLAAMPTKQCVCAMKSVPSKKCAVQVRAPCMHTVTNPYLIFSLHRPPTSHRVTMKKTMRSLCIGGASKSWGEQPVD